MEFLRTPLINTLQFVGLWLCRMKILFVLPMLLICLYADQASAATIAFEPNSLSVKAAPGERVYVPISVSLKDSNSSSTSAYVRLALSEGSLSPDWLINDQFQMSLNPYNKSRQVLQIMPSVDAKPGVYTGSMVTELLWSNEPIELVNLEVHVEISQQDACLEPPEFSNVVSAQDTINTRNNKKVTVNFTGNVVPPSGCELKRVWYELVDEYGEVGHQEEIQFDKESGSFAVDLPLIASRRGDDMDGRLYTVIFKAENLLLAEDLLLAGNLASGESAVAESVETTIVVKHNNRKK